MGIVIKKNIIQFVLMLVFGLWCFSAYCFDRGIYVTRGTVLGRRFQSLSKQAKRAHINTMVVDFTRSTPRYRLRIAALQKQGFKVVLRVVVFPGGARSHHVQSKSYMAKQYKKIASAARLGVDAIQLDYIRYSVKQRWSKKNSQDIYHIVKHVRHLLKPYDTELQVDIFGIVAHAPSHVIGQDVSLLAHQVDVFCPMVYPSHYQPHHYHGKRPYQTVYDSLMALRAQLKDFSKIKIIAYIEASNFRHRWSPGSRARYLRAEIRAVEDAKVDGWYVWSAKNHYRTLFSLYK